MAVFFETVEKLKMSERDSQRAKLYRAENAALKDLKSPLPTVQDVERYLRKQSKRATLRARYGNAVDVVDWKLQVTDGRGTRRGLAHGSYKISLPLFARNDFYVCHEWAHIIHSRLSSVWFSAMGKRRVLEPGSRSIELRGGASHGWQYAAIYLDVVRFCMGAEAYQALKASFRAHKVRFKPKRSRQATPAMIERLALARAAKSKI